MQKKKDVGLKPLNDVKTIEGRRVDKNKFSLQMNLQGLMLEVMTSHQDSKTRVTLALLYVMISGSKEKHSVLTRSLIERVQ
jgi:hypothetical protein